MGYPAISHIPCRSLAISVNDDEPDIRQKYRPFILAEDTGEDWINDLELTTVLDMAENDLRNTNKRLKVLVLYGSLRKRSYSRLVAFEASRILFRLGCDVRVFNPEGLPVKNDTDHNHPKVQELRELSKWSDGHVWVSPEQHGNLVSYISHFIYLCELDAYNLQLPDCGVQKPNRLGSLKYRKHSSNTRQDACHCSGVWWIAIIQCGQLVAHPRQVDADVHHPQSIFHPESIYTFSRRRSTRRSATQT